MGSTKLNRPLLINRSAAPASSRNLQPNSMIIMEKPLGIADRSITIGRVAENGIVTGRRAAPVGGQDDQMGAEKPVG